MLNGRHSQLRVLLNDASEAGFWRPHCAESLIGRAGHIAALLRLVLKSRSNKMSAYSRLHFTHTHPGVWKSVGVSPIADGQIFRPRPMLIADHRKQNAASSTNHKTNHKVRP